jgi:adenine-specific DNA methylase
MKFIEEVTEEKLRGGIYTPTPIADFILKWAVNGNNNFNVLEPSCGDGIFLKRIKENNFQYKSNTAIEIDPIDAEKARKIKIKKFISIITISDMDGEMGWK